MRTAIAFLMHGYLGSGKTTLARRLEAHESAIRFTHDEWMQALYGDDPPDRYFAEYKQRVFKLMEATWTRCLALNINVVLDFGLWSRSERDHVRDIVASLGCVARLYHLSCPNDLAWDRIEKRNEHLKASLFISPNTFIVLRSRFEPLDPDEARIEIDTTGQVFTDGDY